MEKKEITVKNSISNPFYIDTRYEGLNINMSRSDFRVFSDIRSSLSWLNVWMFGICVGIFIIIFKL